MATSFEVGSVFQIVDKATPTILKLAKAVSDLGKVSKDTKLQLQSLGAVKLTGLNTSLKTATDRVVALQAAADKANNGIVASTNAAASSVQNLAAQWRNAATAARATATAARGATPSINPGSVGGGGRGGNPRNILGAGVSGPRVPIPGGGHFHMRGGNAAMLAAGAIGYGIYQESELDDAAYRALFTAGVPQDRNVQQSRMKQFRDIISAASAKTGASIHDLSEAALTEVRQFAGFSWDQRMKALPQILAYGAAEGKLKGSSVEEGTDAIIGYAHMLKTYDPQSIAGMADKFGYLSTMNPANITSMLRASGYAVPILQNLGFDPFQVMELQSVMTRAGILNTKSGTWLRELGVRSLPGTSMMSRMAFGKHEKALSALGLVDGNNKPTWFTDGAPDMAKLLEIASQRAAKIPLADRAGLEKQLFGSQGAGAFSVLADPRILQMLPQLKAEMDNFKSGNQFFADYANNSPVQQFMQTWADLRNVLMDIGNVALPPIIGSLQLLDSWLKSIHDNTPSFLIPKKDSLGTALGKGMGAGALAGAGVGALGGLAVGGPVGVVPGALGGAVYGAFGGGLLEGIRHFFGGSDSPVMKGSEAGTEKGAREGVIQGFQRMSFTGGGFGGGSGASLIPAMYTSSGSFGGSSSTGGGASRGFGGSSSGIGPMGRIPHHASSLGGIGTVPDSIIPSGLTGNAYIAARRGRFAEELKDPNKRLQFAAMLLSEGGGVATAESAMNRSDFSHKSLMQMLHSGFYGPINRGQLPGFIAQLQRNPKLMAKMNGFIDKAIGGSDTITGYTDQGMWNDPNGPGRHLRKFGVTGPYLKSGGNYYNDWQSIDGNTGPARWRRQFEAGAHAVPPAPTAREIHIHNSHILEGRVIAKSVTKHIVKMGNGPATGARLPDYSATRPLSI